MFSYRHAFHAGNHADVLKHTVLIATLQYLTEKDAALTVLDTHAGAGLYRLDGDYARTSGEAGEGILRLTATGAPSGLRPAETDPAGQPIEPRAINREIPFQISAAAARQSWRWIAARSLTKP